MTAMHSISAVSPPPRHLRSRNLGLAMRVAASCLALVSMSYGCASSPTASMSNDDYLVHVKADMKAQLEQALAADDVATLGRLKTLAMRGRPAIAAHYGHPDVQAHQWRGHDMADFLGRLKKTAEDAERRLTYRSNDAERALLGSDCQVVVDLWKRRGTGQQFVKLAQVYGAEPGPFAAVGARDWRDALLMHVGRCGQWFDLANDFYEDYVDRTLALEAEGHSVVPAFAELTKRAFDFRKVTLDQDNERTVALLPFLRRSTSESTCEALDQLAKDITPPQTFAIRPKGTPDARLLLISVILERDCFEAEAWVNDIITLRDPQVAQGGGFDTWIFQEACDYVRANAATIASATQLTRTCDAPGGKIETAADKAAAAEEAAAAAERAVFSACFLPKRRAIMAWCKENPASRAECGRRDEAAQAECRRGQ